MTSLIATSSAARSVSASALRAAASRPPHASMYLSPFKLNLNLTDSGDSLRCMSSMMHDNDPVTIEIEKRRTLSREQHARVSPPNVDAPGWNEHLASASEAFVKADRGRLASPSDLQKETVEYVKSRYSDDRMGPTTAFYTRDEKVTHKTTQVVTEEDGGLTGRR
ncbi:hypothetical protein LshimejAT787_0802480 [Lyophyllum shimeji]|uniref:Uncharacterized protein n=1 Tax=Lyophyllum shimeji TaxID=47721 RepID=A0A9P3UPJ8_LYOSH|nr:hypothetical protein LshimejAT787_0802480 [Lyophyllum shimeji]